MIKATTHVTYTECCKTCGQIISDKILSTEELVSVLTNHNAIVAKTTKGHLRIFSPTANSQEVSRAAVYGALEQGLLKRIYENAESWRLA